MVAYADVQPEFSSSFPSHALRSQMKMKVSMNI